MPGLIVNILLVLLENSTVLYPGAGNNHTCQGGKDLVEILHRHAKQDSEIVHLDHSSDTLIIVSTHEFCTYPLGRFSGFMEFETEALVGKPLSISAEECSSMPVRRYAFDGGYVKVLKPQEGTIELVFARVGDKGIFLPRGIEIGQDRSAVLSVFFNDLKDLEFDAISVIRIESGVTGVWQYYTYQEGKLQSIVIDSDYQCDKS